MGSPPGVPHKGARDGRGWPCRGGGGREAVTSTTLYTCSISWILYGSRGRGRGGPEPSCSPQIQRGSSLWCSLGFVCGSQGFSCFLARLICMHHPQGHPPPRSGLLWPAQPAPRDQLQGVLGTVARGERGHYCRGAPAGPHPSAGLPHLSHLRKPPHSLPLPSTPDSLQAPPSAHSPAPVSESLQHLPVTPTTPCAHLP